MAIGVIFDDISSVVSSSTGESGVMVKGSQRFLLIEEGPCLLPSRPSLDGLIVNLLL